MVDFKKLAKHISVAGVEDLKASRETFNDNLFSSFLRKLKRSMNTRRLNMPGSLLHADRMTPESDASDSSNEDKEEEVSRLCIPWGNEQWSAVMRMHGDPCRCLEDAPECAQGPQLAGVNVRMTRMSEWQQLAGLEKENDPWCPV